MEGQLEQAFRASGLKEACLRREGDEVLYREVNDASPSHQL